MEKIIFDDTGEKLVFTECNGINIFNLKQISKDLLQGLELVNTDITFYQEKQNLESSSIYILDYSVNTDNAPTAYVYTY